MIQRKQSLFLLLVAIVAIVTVWKVELSNWSEEGIFRQINDWSAVAAAGISLLSIFLFKTRKLQLKVVAFALILGVASLGAFILEYFQNQSTHDVLPVAGLHLIVLLGLILAISGIKKDEKLVRSLDRLR